MGRLEEEEERWRKEKWKERRMRSGGKSGVVNISPP